MDDMSTTESSRRPDDPRPAHPTVRAGLLMVGVVIVLLVLSVLSTVR